MKTSLKKVLSLSLVLLLLITSAPFAAFAESAFTLSPVTAGTTTATATLSGTTTGSTIGLTLSSPSATPTLNGNTVEMTGLTPNTPYTLTVTENYAPVATELVVTINSSNDGWITTSSNVSVPNGQVYVKVGNSKIYRYDFGFWIAIGLGSTPYAMVPVTAPPLSKTVTFTTAPEMFALTLNTAGTGLGTITADPLPAADGYQADTDVTLTAAATAGSEFIGWSNELGTNPVITVTMNESKTITATFNTIVTYDLTVIKNGTGEGTVTAVPEGNTFVTGTKVTLTAAATAGSEFIGWSGGYGSEASIEVTMDASKTITATFNKIANMYFSVDNEIKVFHNGNLLVPVYKPAKPTTGTHEWQLVKHYYVENLAVGDIIAVEGTDVGVIAGFIGEIRINDVTYPTKVDSFWKQSVVLQEGWNAKNFMMDETWGAVTKHSNSDWNNKLVGAPTGFNADWIWSANNNFGTSANHVVYFRYVVGGFPSVTFDSNGGNEFAPVTVTAGTTFDSNDMIVPVPVKTGFNFTKWVLVDSTTEFNGTYVINGNTQVIAQYTPVVPETTGNTQPTTEAPQPVVQATTEAAVVVIEEEEVALGEANIFNFDSFIDESVVTETTTEAASDEEIVIDEATPLADALPQTGQLPVELFYGVGGLITAAGVFLKKRK